MFDRPNQLVVFDHVRRRRPTCAPSWFAGASILGMVAILCVQSFCSAPAEEGLLEERLLEERGLGEPQLDELQFDELQLPTSSALPDEAPGLRIEPVYHGECFTNARGGISTSGAARYLGLLDLGIAVDFARLRIPAPGKFFVLAQNTQGQGLTQDFVGDTMVYSNIDAFRAFTQVGEYWWEVGMLEDAVTLRLGKQDVNHEFYFMDTARDFIQSGFTLSPNAKFPSYPQQAMAAVALVQLDESLQFKVGIWDALAKPGSWGVSGQETVLITSELELAYALGEGTLPGRLALGAGYLSEGELEGASFGDGHGYSLQWEQRILSECADDAPDVEATQGLSLFAAYYPRFPSAPVLKLAIGESYAAGLVYTGLVAQRDQDVLGVGAVRSELNQGGTDRETAFELFYRVVFSEHAAIQPDLQYIVTPSGVHPDSLVIGVRLQLNL